MPVGVDTYPSRHFHDVHSTDADRMEVLRRTDLHVVVAGDIWPLLVDPLLFL